ncbi:hypothetical protein HKD37_11G032643 [Glycine soja]
MQAFYNPTCELCGSITKCRSMRPPSPKIKIAFYYPIDQKISNDQWRTMGGGDGDHIQLIQIKVVLHVQLISLPTNTERKYYYCKTKVVDYFHVASLSPPCVTSSLVLTTRSLITALVLSILIYFKCVFLAFNIQNFKKM